MPRKTRKKPRVDRQRRRRCSRVRGGMTDEEVTALVGKEMATLFPEIDSSDIRYRVLRHNTAVFIVIDNCRESQLHYGEYYPGITIDFKKHIMKIEVLTGCSPISGREMLSRLITLARNLGLSYVVLDDASELYVHPSMYGREKCMLSLAYVRILLKGESWYQSLGFVTPQNVEDREHNERIRAMPLRDFVIEIVEREKGTHVDAESFLASLVEVFPELDADMRVSDAIQKIMTAVNAIHENVCESREFQLLKRLVVGCKWRGKDGKPLLRYTYKDRVLSLMPAAAASSNAPNTSS